MKDAHKLIDNLSPDDALSILKSLAADDPPLATRIAEMALKRRTDVDPEEVAAELYDALEALEVEELWDRAGETRDGYVEPGEAAEQMIDGVLEPFLEEMKRYQKMGLTLEARQMCTGLLLGLHQFKYKSTSEFKDWAPDSPIVFAEVVVDAWQDGHPSGADVQALKAFIEDELNGWGPKVGFKG